ncbi:GAD-like domain-containing protein [Nocardia sp. alder85J]|uniref:GAD-like domain-containing protein n=1 Tax=Nocardia sp. alder85J TaxID=2862949 RepID=UPI001CD6BD82|nr:GAD-like domain-containing protein [Nocardia sp. alder85J]MCX4091313.1 GAD-like domain-containing protein [Nocardia sp. alder85J]
MSRITQAVLRNWGRPTFLVEPPAERFAQFRGVLPPALLDVWSEFGFSGFDDGRWWICDPVVWQPAVDAWTAGLELPGGPDSWIAVTRSAFGRMKLWSASTGLSLTVLPYLGWLMYRASPRQVVDETATEKAMYVGFLGQTKDNLDVPDEDGDNLFPQVLGRLGPVAADTMYGFVPAPALGGPLAADHVEIFEADVHMQLLSDLTPRQVMERAA